MNCQALLAMSLVACLGFAACATDGVLPSEGHLTASPKQANGFNPNAQVEIVVARAEFVEDHERVFGADLIDELGIVPIALTLGVVGAGSEHEIIYANVPKMNFHLYLEDGTVLEGVTPTQAAGSNERLERAMATRALSDKNLPNFNAAERKFVYFRLAPRDHFEVSGGRIQHKSGSTTRTLSMARSLLSFKLQRGGSTLHFHVGVGRG